ncbi:hypothetical protein [Haladaptatus caseinilyticus]|uniref:hypothetical protein n=1 Tax=Haladaptatus caseinilyticus TaxID=2993314 RepID=UPI00224AC845|nr:hypothetical protein [Haladaptatus caseinilyticus]
MGSRTSDSTVTVFPTLRAETSSVLLFASGLALLTRGVAPSPVVEGGVGVLGSQVNASTTVLALVGFAVSVAYASRGGSVGDCWTLSTAPLIGLFLAAIDGLRLSGFRLLAPKLFGLCLFSGTMFGTFAYLLGRGFPTFVHRSRTRT